MNTIEDIVGRVLGLDSLDVTDETSAKDIEAWDSLAHMNLVLEIEKAFSISIAPGDAIEMTSLSSIKSVLKDYGVAF